MKQPKNKIDRGYIPLKTAISIVQKNGWWVDIAYGKDYPTALKAAQLRLERLQRDVARELEELESKLGGNDE